jgi:quercetin dioxygenase-like cupin family protein
MRQKLAWFALSTGIMVTALFHATPAMSTPPDKFTSTTLAQGQFAPIDVSSYFITDKDKLWFSLQKTKGKSDGYVLSNVWQPGGSTGWHTHLSHTLIIVTAGAVTEYKGDDPSCTPHVYTAGMTFVERGGTHVHIVRNEGTVEAQTVAVRLIPAGQPGRIDAPDPGNCHF